MTVSEVKPDRVKFTLGDESEEGVLRVATGPKTTTQPAAPAPAGQPGAPGQPPALPGAGPPPPTATSAQPANPQEAQTLLERRRAARAAAAAQQGDNAAAPAAVAPNPAVQQVPPGTPAVPTPQADPRWAEVYKRMMQRGN